MHRLLAVALLVGTLLVAAPSAAEPAEPLVREQGYLTMADGTRLA